MLELFFLFLLALLLVLPVWLWRGAPFVPTDPGKINRLVRLARVKPGERAADLGSGDGRLVIALAQAGATAHGLEANPFLVWWSRYLIRRLGLHERASVVQKNFWHCDLAPYSLVVVFGVGGKMMAELERKLELELAPGARVISNGFPFPTWPVAARDGSLYLYRQS